MGGADYQWSFTTAPRVAIAGITFTDANLQTCVAERAETWVDEITSFTCQSRSIADLSGIEHLKGLISLFMTNNGITDFTPLSSLTGLKELALSGTGLTDADLADIADNFTGLTSLFMDNNSITDVSPLSGLTILVGLHLSSNGITDVSPLSSLTGLESLYLSSNSITDVSPLSSLTGLVYLYLRDNSITTCVADLVTLKSATTIDLEGSNCSIPCADLDALEAVFASSVVSAICVETIDWVDRGFYRDIGDHDPDNTVPYTGFLCDVTNCYDYNSFIVFDLSGITRTVIGATLRVAVTYASADPSENLSVYDVSTDIATLTAGGTGLTGIHADLETGNNYGGLTVTSADTGSVMEIPLNPPFSTDSNAARGGLFAVGVSYDTGAGDHEEKVTLKFNTDETNQLVLKLQ